MYNEKQIINLNKEDNLVAISGFIVSANENSFVLDDKASQIIVLAKDSVNIGDYVRVFGNLVFNNDEKMLQSAIIQNLNSINKELHQKVLKML